MKSFRLQFVDIDSSFSISTATADIKGYIAVRAPKGDVEATYFEPGNENLIKAMVGYPSADWPDIYEAIAFNNEYGLYLSAAPGSSTSYPSYYGGYYVTESGYYPFYKEGSSESLSYVVDATDYVEDEATLIVDNNDIIFNVQPGYTLEYDDGTKATTIKNMEGARRIISGGWIADKIKVLSNYAIASDGVSIIDTLDEAAEAVQPNSDLFFLGLGKFIGKVEDSASNEPEFSVAIYDNSICLSINSVWTPASIVDVDSFKLVLNALKYNNGDLTIGDAKYEIAIPGDIRYLKNIKKETIIAIVQKTPTECETKVTIDSICTDKYKYDMRLAFASDETEKNSMTYNKTLSAGKPGLFVYENQLYTVSKDNNTKTKVESDEYKTKYIKAGNIIFYVGDAGTLTICEEDNEPKLKKNVNFNTVSLSCYEIDMIGKKVPGGEFTGSMSPTGVDAGGANIYWPNVLPKETATFIEVIPVNSINNLNSFDNNTGIWSGFDFGDEPFELTLKGQRTITKYVNQNIEDGYNGCAWSETAAPIFEMVINDGLTEAQNDLYDDALVIMEPTGQEVFKSKLMALRTTYHNTSTVISPKIIKKSEFENPSTIVINGRATGTAQYIGEFKMYDSQTGKYYWCQPIGDVGCMLARIMDKELGGIAPAGTNNNKGCGGILSRAVLEAKWNWTDAKLKILSNDKSVNPITYTSEYGLMLADHRTTQDPLNVTDWSYLGHSMAFDLCKREIRDKVMTPQLFKKVNEFYMNIRKKQVDDILAKRTSGSNPMWAEATCDIIGQNTPQTKLKRQFVIKVTCKVNVYSESVLLMFENISQDS